MFFKIKQALLLLTIILAISSCGESGSGGKTTDNDDTDNLSATNSTITVNQSRASGCCILIPCGEEVVTTTLSSFNATGVGPLNYKITTYPTKGSISNFDETTGEFSYTPGTDVCDSFPCTDTIGFAVTNSEGKSKTSSVTVNFNRYPVDNSQKINVNAGIKYSGQLQVSDLDGDELKFSKIDDPALGTLTINSDGSFEYTANTDTESTADIFSYQISDGLAIVNSRISVNINAKPEANDINLISQPNIQSRLKLNAVDKNSDLLTYKIITNPTKGDIEINKKTGYILYNANKGEIGQDSFTYTANDGTLESNIATVNIEIKELPVKSNGQLLTDFDSNLPLLIIDVNQQFIESDPKIKGVVTVIPANSRSSLSKTPEYSGSMEIDLRGSSSLNFAKKGYGLDIETIDGENKDVSLLGMPAHHKWTLHAPYSDKSLMRNYIAYTKSRDLGGYTAVRNKFVEVLIKQDTYYEYNGVYLLTEKISRDKERVDVNKDGFILRRDRHKGDWSFSTTKTLIVVDYPNTKDLTQEQKTHLQNYFQNFEDALYSADFNNTNSNEYYKKWINTDSFINRLISRELFRDVDTWGLSEFFNKEKDGKINMNPVWDFNLGMGNANYGYNGSSTGWNHSGRINRIGGWMNRLMSDPDFKNKVGQKWHSMRAGVWSDANLNSFIDETKTLLNESQSRNFQKWQVLGKYVWPNRKNVCSGGEYCDSWEKAVDEHLRVWLLSRAAWMDANLPNIPPTPLPKIIISEIHYNPANGTENEFVELYNDENTEVDISNWQLSGVTHTFAPNSKIASKSTLIIAKDSSKYAGSVQWTSGKLSNGGEKIELKNDSGVLIDAVEYDDIAPWPVASDGTGPSLELKADKLNTTDNDDGTNWQASAVDGGTPGTVPAIADTTAPTLSSSTPTDDSTDVAIDSNIVLVFDEAVAVNSGNIVIHKTSDDSVVETIDITSGLVTGTGTTTLTVNPANDLLNSTGYYLLIDSGAIEDMSGNSFIGITNKTTLNWTTITTP